MTCAPSRPACRCRTAASTPASRPANGSKNPESVASLAMIALRHSESASAFGLLVLGSPDPTRYAADMGTEFLARLGEIASAGLSRLLPPF